MREIIATDKAGPPAGVYSQAVKVGNLVFTAGMGPNDPSTGKLVHADDIYKQTIRTLENLQAALEAAGTSLEHAVRCGVFIHDIGEWLTFNEAYRSFFSRFDAPPPSRTTISVGGFPEGMTVEIDVIAVVPD